jgi:glyoxylase-like metal-dependent hydrolase (beta-lactamase superfamily II)
MPDANRKREVGRGERVIPGIWRLRLPLPWPGVPHCNAWAIASGDGIVLVDCGLHEPGSLAHLERALEQVNLRLEHVRLLVCTHAHADHYGQASAVIERSGCALWMHGDHGHMVSAASDPDATLDRRIEIARQSGVPEAPLERLDRALRGVPYGVAKVIEPDRALTRGMHVDTDLGTWDVYETPGHAPSHICLYQETSRILISGDHLLGRVSLFYDYGYTPDPAGEFLHSLDLVQELDARLCLSGHGRPFTDVQGHIEANRRLARRRLERLHEALDGRGERTAFDAMPGIYDDPLTPANAPWRLNETLAYLAHLRLEGRVTRIDGAPERWAAV